MRKVFGVKECFIPVRQEKTRVVYSFFKEDVDEHNATWYEVYFNKKQNPNLTLEQIKAEVIAGVNDLTEQKILTGFVWEGKKVWLSKENQFNFKAAYDIAVQTNGMSLPVKFKLGEQEDCTPVYHNFDTLAELQDFYTKAIAYINDCLNNGWQLKDSIDFSAYELSS